MKKRAKSKQEMDEVLRIRIPGFLKERLETIARNRPMGPGHKAVSVSDVVREYLVMAAQKDEHAEAA